jgi:hypothetical protein
MIDSLYDNVLSISNEIGYIDFLENNPEFTSPLRFSVNYKIFKNIDDKDYPIVGFGYCDVFRTPFSFKVKFSQIIKYL